MFNYNINRSTKNISIIIIAILAFIFLHSEFGLFDLDENNHNTHDYCEIIKNTTSQSKILQQKLPKYEFNDIIYFHCYEKNEKQTAQIAFEIVNHNLRANSATDIYLFNRTFLI